jgi:hypothetical protein
MKASVMISFLPWQERDTRLIAKLCPVDDKKKIGKERKKAIRRSNKSIEVKFLKLTKAKYLDSWISKEATALAGQRKKKKKQAFIDTRMLTGVLRYTHAYKYT